MGIGVARIDGDRTPVRVDGAVPPVVGLEDDAEIAVPVRLIGQREGPLLPTALADLDILDHFRVSAA